MMYYPVLYRRFIMFSVAKTQENVVLFTHCIEYTYDKFITRHLLRKIVLFCLSVLSLVLSIIKERIK